MKMPQKPRPISQIYKEKGVILTKAMGEMLQSDLLKKYNEEYLHWDELRRRDLTTDPEIFWAMMKIIRAGQYTKVAIGDLTLFYNSTASSQHIMHVLDTGASGFIVVLDEALTKKDMNRYVITSLMEEAIASSQLEGAVTTTKAAKRMLSEKRKPRSPSEQMIVNDFTTMQRIKKAKDEPLTTDLILELHALITHNTLEDSSDEGRFRSNDEIVVADVFEVERIFHQPPPYIKIQNYMQGLCDFANKTQEGNFQHPLIKAILIHYMIGYIHAFVDGNGRLARALMYWYALRNGYWLFEHMAISKVIKESRGGYGNAYLYAETDDNDVTYFINYNLMCMEKALENTRHFIEKKQKEQEEALKIARSHPELNYRQSEILKYFAKHKDEPITANDVVSKYNVVPQTARTDLLLLYKLEFVEMRKIGRKLVFFYREKEKTVEENPHHEVP
jgi:Fic family protein